jgi:uncharacterized Ntn-hydrolase superfamily protein
MTFSLVARCRDTGQFGVAISSSSPAVAARCSYVRAGVGAAATQNVTYPRLGPLALDLMQGGMGAPEAIAGVRDLAQHPDHRQVLAIDRNGDVAIHSGTKALGIWSEARGADVAAGGNLLANDGVPAAIVARFEAATGHLGDRMLAALRGGLAAGGEAGPVHSAGLLIADRQVWPLVDLRCDWTEDCPIAALSAAWEVYRPQMDDYVQRALDPSAAPSYGVPGDA